MTGDRVFQAIDACLVILEAHVPPAGLVAEDAGAEAFRVLGELELDEWSVRIVWQGIAINVVRAWADDTGQAYVDVMAKLRSAMP